ncbi:S-layer homology domain-containing protein [Paenibacillus oenotherae]|uniref:S-layer homology domain-containing protein n=1 Tax=Paenibacillus oenotherae TaxID=1435645 RepID=A0ABS7DBA3_9BACL|nr:S-layer homology domain-containing protein [Paenibacillus oenotherae]MBW7476438.1 S-layer homology domain-containing protein [Paenibacillus oenotherae]
MKEMHVGDRPRFRFGLKMYISLVGLTILSLISTGVSTAAPYSRTEVMDGQNNFTAAEYFDTSNTNVHFAHLSWDSTYIYFGFSGIDIGSNDATKWLMMYIGGAGGTTTGQTYLSQQPQLPFSAKYHFKWKAGGDYHRSVSTNSGSTWSQASWSAAWAADSTTMNHNGTFIEYKIKRSDLGNPLTLQLLMFMLDEQSGSEWTWASVPSNSITANMYDPDFTTFYEFDLSSSSSSRKQVVDYTFAASAVNATTSNFTFKASAGATNVKIQQSTNGGSTWTDSTTASALSASSTSATVTGLTPNTSYKFRLAVTGGANAGGSAIVNVTTISPVPVNNFTSAAVTGDSASFTWGAATGATSLAIEKSTNGGTTWTAASTSSVLNPGDTSATVTGLNPTTSYTFRLVVTGGDRAGNSNTAAVTTTTPVSSFASTGKTSTTVDVGWSVVSGASSLAIEKSSDGGVVWSAATTSGALGGSSTSATVTGLSANTSYTFRLVVTGGANAGNSNTVAVTTLTVPVSNFASTGKTSTSADFGWSAVSGASSLAIEKSSDGGVVWSAATTSGALGGSSTSATVTGLSANTSYTFRLVVTGGANAGNSNTVAVTTLSVPVSDFASMGKTSTSVDFGWSAVSGASSLAIEKSSDGGVVWSAATTSGALGGSSTSATVTGLSANTSYTFRLVVTSGANAGNSNTVAVTTLSVPVSDFASTGKTSTTADFGWSVVSGASSLAIEKSTDGGTTWGAATTSGALSGSSTSATVTGLSANTSYMFRLIVTGGANAGNSNTVAVTTLSVPVSDFASTGKTSTTADFGWSVVSGASSLAIEQSTDGGTTWSAATTSGALGGSDTGSTVTGLSANTSYTFRLVVVGGANAGNSNAVAVTTLSVPVSDFATTGKTSTTADFGWSAVSGASSLVIEQSTDGGITWGAATTSGALAGSSTSATVTGLSANINYSFRLVVTGGANAGNSNAVAVTTLPVPVSDFASTGKTSTTADFDWSAVSGASSLAIEQSTDGGTTWSAATTSGALGGSDTSATVTGLSANTSYSFRLVVTGGANAGNSNAVALTTLSVPVSDFSSMGKTSATADFGWSVVSGATSLAIEQSTDGGTTWGAATTSGALGGSDTSATVTGLSANTSYTFRLVVIGGANAGNSNAVAVTTLSVPVSDFATTGKTSATADFGWSVVSGATSLAIEQSTDGGTTWGAATTSGVLGGSDTSATVTGLSANTSYTFRLVVTGGANAGDSNAVAVTTLSVPVSDFATTGKTSTTADFGWSAVSGASSLAIEQSSDGGTTWSAATTSGALVDSSTSATVTGLSANTNYTFRLVVTGGGNAGNSNTVAVTTLSVPVSDFSSMGKTSATADFGWSAVSGASSLAIEQSTDGGTTWGAATTSGVLGGSDTSATVTGLNANTSYTFRLVVTGGANAGNSNAVAVTTLSVPVSDFATTGKTSATADFGWSVVSGATSLAIEQSTDGGTTWGAATTSGALGGSDTSATVTGLSANTSYTFRLVVIGGANAGNSNAVAVTTLSVPVSDFATTGKTSTTADFGWSAVSGASLLAIEQSTDGGTTWSAATTSGALAGSSTSATVTGLNANTSYTFRLVVTGGGNAGNSNTVAVTTLSVPVSDFSSMGKTSATADFGWSVVSGATSLAIEQSTDGGTTWGAATTSGALAGSSTSATVTGLSANTNYTFRLVVTGGANAGNSNTVAVTTLSVPVSDFASTGKTSTTADFGWSAVSGATSLAIEQSTDGGTTWSAATTSGALGGSDTSATVTGLSANTSYSFRLVVTGGANAGNSNAVAVTTLSVPVSDFATAGKTSATADFGWSAVSGASLLAIEQSTDGGTTWSAATTSGVLGGSDTSATVTGLSANTSYSFRLVITGGANAGNSNAVAVTTLSVPVSDFATTGKTSTTADFGWSAVSGATSLAIEQSTDGGTTWSTSTTSGALGGSDTSATVTGLSANTSYMFRITATGGANAGISNTVSVTTPTIPIPGPVAISDFTSTGQTPTTASFSWSAASGATALAIEQSTDGGATWSAAASASPITASDTTTTITGLSANTSYMFRITATGGANAGISNTVSVTTPTTPIPGPVAISDFTSTGQTPTTASFSWSAASGATALAIELSTDGGATWSAAASASPITASDTTTTITGLSANTSYMFRIIATGGANAGISNTVSVTTPTIPIPGPVAISDFTSTGQTPTTASFSWSAASGATALAIEQSTDGGTTWSAAAPASPITASDTTTTVTGLSANTSYMFRITATGGANAGISNMVSVTTSMTPIPGSVAISDFTSTGQTPTTASFSWSAASGATALAIEQSTDGGATWSASAPASPITASDTTTTVTGLSANTSYMFRIIATGGANAGISNTVSVTTPTIPIPGPVAISDFTSTGKTAATASFNWSIASGAASAGIELSLDGGVTWSAAATASPISASDTSATATGLNASTSYLFRLVIAGGANAGASNIVTVTTASGTNGNPGGGGPIGPVVIAPFPGPIPENDCSVVADSNNILVKGCLNKELDIVKATVDDTSLNNKLNSILHNMGSKDELFFKMEQTAGQYQISLPLSSIKNMQEHGIDLVFTFNDRVYRVPSELLNLDASGQASLPSDSSIVFTSRMLNGEEKSRLIRLAQQQGLEILADFSAFTIAVNTGSNASSIPVDFVDFGKSAIELTVPINNANKVTGVVYLPNGKLAFAPYLQTGKESGQLMMFAGGIYGLAKYEKTFDDIRNRWSQQDIEVLASKLIVQGKTANLFDPQAPITRAEFATLLVRLTGVKLAEGNVPLFSDVSANAWYASYVEAAFDLGIVTGYEDGTFQPNKSITREEMAAMISRLMVQMKVSGPDEDPAAAEDVLAQFADREKISGYAGQAVTKLVSEGIMKGDSNGSFQPQHQTTREQAAAVVRRFLQYVKYIN